MDIAGIDDSDGDMIKYINTLIDKKIFKIAKDIKILFVFNIHTFTQSRGSLIVELIKLM